MTGGVSIIISPLRALIQDQVTRLCSMDVRWSCWVMVVFHNTSNWTIKKFPNVLCCIIVANYSNFCKNNSIIIFLNAIQGMFTFPSYFLWWFRQCPENLLLCFLCYVYLNKPSIQHLFYRLQQDNSPRTWIRTSQIRFIANCITKLQRSPYSM